MKKSLFSELRRRRVLKVLGVYAVGAWAAIEVSATTFPLLGLPELAARLVVVVALVGVPIATALAWFFDLTPHGIVRTPELDEATPAPARQPSPAAAAATAAHRGLAGRAAGYFGLGMLVALVSVAAYFRFGSPGGLARDPSSIESIAVLPFADLSAAGDHEYFSDGMTEELLDRLAHVEGLRVAARTSSFAFKKHNEDIREIGRRLGVESVLEGSIRRDGNQLRVTAQLIDARTGYHLWSETYDREAAGVFAIQDEISNAIVDALRKQFAGSDPGALRRTENLRAHDLYLQGLLRWHYRGEASVLQSIQYFEQALAEDPEYAPALAGIAQAYAVLPSLGRFPAEEAIAKGTAAAAKALAIDARLPEAHAALGQIAQSFEWNFEDAERAYRRAIDFNPSYATAHQWYAETLLMMGRTDEARAEINRALELDPLSPSALSVRAYLFSVQGDYDSAVAQYDEIASRYVDYPIAHINRVLLAAFMRRSGDASSSLSVASGGDSAVQTAMRTVIESGAGNASRDAAAAIDGAVPPGLASLWFAAAGSTDQAIVRLDSATARPEDPNVPFILFHPLLIPLRADPRFVRIAERVGITFPR